MMLGVSTEGSGYRSSVWECLLVKGRTDITHHCCDRTPNPLTPGEVNSRKK